MAGITLVTFFGARLSKSPHAGFHLCHLNAENLDRIEDTTECLLALSVFGANHA
jgi:hypothetical protein